MGQSQNLAVRGLSPSGGWRVFASVTTQLVSELQSRHGTWPVATAALGRTATVAGMMGMMLKGDERLTIQIKGDGPLGSITVDADSKGDVRGFVTNPQVELPLNAQGKLNVGGAVGQGMLYVMRDMGLRDYYTSSAELASGEIGDDFTYYFTTSEQTPSSVGAGVLVDRDFSVICAGGFIIQMLPGHSEQDIAEVESNLSKIKSLTDFLKTGASVEDLMHWVAPGVPVAESREIQFACSCHRDRMESVLQSLGEAEIRALIQDVGQAEIVCHFCNEKYLFTKDELEALL